MIGWIYSSNSAVLCSAAEPSQNRREKKKSEGPNQNRREEMVSKMLEDDDLDTGEELPINALQS